MLEPRTVEYTYLLLDPNNPRLAQSFGDGEVVRDEEIKARQDEMEKKFGIAPEHESQEELDRLIGDSADLTTDDFFSIRDLKDSMRRIGFVGIQNIIVREINDSGKYVVIEGNRRVASIKAVIREHERALPGTRDRIEEKAKLDSLQTIEVMVLQTKGLTPDEIEKSIGTTLGLRHYGAQLKWDLLPRAKNIYDEYIKLSPEPFKYTPKNGNHVAEVLAIPTTEVKRLLRGYLCYKQLGDIYPVRPHHFSLILAGIENTNLTAYQYFNLDRDETFELLGDTAGKLERLCEFGDRDRPDFDNTIKDPKEFKNLGLILKDSNRHESETIRNYAQGLFIEVVEKQIPLDEAYRDLIAFKKKHQWVQAIQALLEKQANDDNLHPDKFINEGQELKLRDELRVLLKRYMAVMDM